MQPPHRTGVHTFCLLAAICPGPAGLGPDARCHRDGLPQGSFLAAAVLGRYHGRTQFLSHRQHSTSMCRDDSLDCLDGLEGLEGANLPRQSSAPPSIPNYVPAYLPTLHYTTLDYMHYMQLSCIASRPQLPSTYRQNIGDLWAQFPTHRPYHHITVFPGLQVPKPSCSSA